MNTDEDVIKVVMCLDDDDSPRPSLLKDIDFIFLYPETHEVCNKPCVELVRKGKGKAVYEVVGDPWPINLEHADLRLGAKCHPWFVTCPVVASEKSKAAVKGCVEFEIMGKRVKKGQDYIWVVSVCRRPRISSCLPDSSCGSEPLENSFDLLNASHPTLLKATSDPLAVLKQNFPVAAYSLDTANLTVNNGHPGCLNVLANQM